MAATIYSSNAAHDAVGALKDAPTLAINHIIVLRHDGSTAIHRVGLNHVGPCPEEYGSHPELLLPILTPMYGPATHLCRIHLTST